MAPAVSRQHLRLNGLKTCMQVQHIAIAYFSGLGEVFRIALGIHQDLIFDDDNWHVI